MTTAHPTDLTGLLAHSRTLITGLQTASGAYPASPTFSAYRGYCWFRDGSFIADGVSVAGDADSATRFFDWCARVIADNRRQIDKVVTAAAHGSPLPDADMLPARFTVDGQPGDDEWWDFQLDGYGTWLWAVVEHARRHRIGVSRWADAISATVDYLVSSWRRPCFDWWEEHSEAVHISTLGCIKAGLDAALGTGLLDAAQADRAHRASRDIAGLITTGGVADGHLTKWIGSPQLDGSLSALLAPLGVINPASALGRGTIAAIDAQLVADGGVYRFRADTFFGGGRWPLLTCFLGLAKLAAGDPDGARACLDWAASTATSGGDLPEQVDGGRLLDPAAKQQWIDRWGTVATPLLWSHAMLLRLAADLGVTGVAA
ncbi:MAG: glycoside hydrolase family 15 [Propionibacteriaceae bacterium]|jgi:GH15 family glucan-1,4-alpha-glucosidase|nr:glycoside hydrolase family 15 [Propionibacteriaceae bacterium]